MREPRPAPPRRAGYPRLAAAWRLLVAAPLAAGAAHADASLPSVTAHGHGASTGGTPAPTPTPPQRPPMHRLGGKPMAPRLTAAGIAFRVARGAGAMVIHPHGPDEPCPFGEGDDA